MDWSGPPRTLSRRDYVRTGVDRRGGSSGTVTSVKHTALRQLDSRISLAPLFRFLLYYRGEGPLRQEEAPGVWAAPWFVAHTTVTDSIQAISIEPVT